MEALSSSVPSSAPAATYTRRAAWSATINAPAERVFALLDDCIGQYSHMRKAWWRIGRGRMLTVVDAARGQRVGSHIASCGRVFGIDLFAEEVVTVYRRPFTKAWETVGTPRLLVIGNYRLRCELDADATRTRLSAAIDYELPARGIRRLAGLVLGRVYADWRTRRMVRHVVRMTRGAPLTGRPARQGLLPAGPMRPVAATSAH